MMAVNSGYLSDLASGNYYGGYDAYGPGWIGGWGEAMDAYVYNFVHGNGYSDAQKSDSEDGITLTGDAARAAIMALQNGGEISISNKYLEIPNYEILYQNGNNYYLRALPSTYIEIDASAQMQGGVVEMSAAERETLRSLNTPDFIYDNNNRIGLIFSIIEPGFGAAWDAVRASPGAYTNSARILSKAGGAGLVLLNVGLTAYTINKELDNGKFDTHSLVNGAVTTLGVGLTVTGLIISAPAVAIIGAGLGIVYGISQIAGSDDWIDSHTDHWGKNLIK